MMDGSFTIPLISAAGNPIPLRDHQREDESLQKGLWSTVEVVFLSKCDQPPAGYRERKGTSHILCITAIGLVTSDAALYLGVLLYRNDLPGIVYIK